MSDTCEIIPQERIDITKHILDNNGLSNTIALFNGAATTIMLNSKYLLDEDEIKKPHCDTGVMNDYFCMSWVVYPAIIDFITLNRKLNREVSDAVAAYVNGGDSKLIDDYDRLYKENEAFCDMYNNRKLIDYLILEDRDYSNVEAYEELTKKVTELLNSDTSQFSQSIKISYDSKTNKFNGTVNSFDEVSSNVIESNFTVSKYSLYVTFAYVYYFAYSKSTLMNNTNSELFKRIAELFRDSNGYGGFKLLYNVIETEWKPSKDIILNEKDNLMIYNLTVSAEDEDDEVEIATIGDIEDENFN